MKWNKSSYILIVFWEILFSNFCISKAQYARFDHFDTRKGLSQNNVNSLVVDSTGYIWIGTLEGLTRFDGTDFKIFRSIPGDDNTLKGNYIDLLSACPNGNLWVYTKNGEMNLYHASSEKFIFFPDTCFPKNKITSMVSATDSCLWFTSQHSGLYKFDLHTLQSILIKTPFIGGSVSPGQQNLLYWGPGGIYKVYNLQDKVSFQQIFRKPVQTISGIFNDSLLVICSDSIWILNMVKQKKRVINACTPLKESLRDAHIFSVAGYNNEIWFGLSDGLILTHFRDEINDVVKFFYDPYNTYSFHGKDAHSLTFDKAGNLWIGTSKYGINLYCREKNLFKHHQISVLSKSDQEIDPVRAICKTSDGSIWIGFDRLGLLRYLKNEQEVFYDVIHLPGNKTKPIDHVRSIYEDSRGNLWIGTGQGGLCYYNSRLDRIESVILKSGWVWPGNCYFIKEFDKDELTVTGNLGIGIVDLNKMTLKIINNSQLQTTDFIRSIVKDKNKNYWIAFDITGLAKLTPDLNIKYFTREKDGLTDDYLYTLCIVGDTLWFTSNTGLMAFDLNREKIIASYFEPDGLSSNLVYGIIAESGYLWMSTNRGITKLRLADKHFENYLPNDLFKDDAFYKDKEGIIYFGGYDGYISFNPKTFHQREIIPQPKITQLLFNNRKVKVGEQINSRTVLPVSIQKMKLLRLDHKSNSFSLTFDAFPFTYPDRTLFRYRLNGLTNEWVIAAKNENKAVYTNLDPRDYTFEVQAIMNGENWSDPAVLSIQIIPPFWRQLWFRIITTIFIIILVIAFIQLRLYTAKIRNRQLKKKIEEQTRSIKEQANEIIEQKEEMIELTKQLHEADQAKLKFYTNVSHEFRTPLTIIMGYLDKLKDQGMSRFILRNINRNAERLFRLVNQFIDLRKYDQGELKVAVNRFDIIAFTKKIMESFQDLADRKNISLGFSSDKKNLFIWLDKDKTDKILYNLLSNAIKYTGQNGTVQISFVSKEEGLEISISDTGCGIPDKELSSIFTGFYRGEKTSPTIEGKGIGLAFVKALVEVQKATISVNSKVGHGTTFKIMFKWGNLHFNEEEITKSEILTFYHETESDPIPDIESSNPLSEEILLVEDNQELLDYLTSLFNNHYKIRTAINGKDAMEKISQRLPDLIITDLMMPVIDGIEFCKKIREKTETRFIPVIILSAKTDVTSKIEGYKIDIDDYIEKPFHPRLLLTRVNNILNKRSEIRKNMEQFMLISGNKDRWTQADKSFMEKVIVILERNLADQSFSADVLGSELNMSSVSFYRKIKNINGIGPGEFIRKYKLKKAEILIRENNLTIGQICSEVGFQSPSHFRKCFKGEFGMLPSKYVISQKVIKKSKQ